VAEENGFVDRAVEVFGVQIVGHGVEHTQAFFLIFLVARLRCRVSLGIVAVQILDWPLNLDFVSVLWECEE